MSKRSFTALPTRKTYFNVMFMFIPAFRLKRSLGVWSCFFFSSFDRRLVAYDEGQILNKLNICLFWAVAVLLMSDRVRIGIRVTLEIILWIYYIHYSGSGCSIDVLVEYLLFFSIRGEKCSEVPTLPWGIYYILLVCIFFSLSLWIKIMLSCPSTALKANFLSEALPLINSSGFTQCSATFHST